MNKLLSFVLLLLVASSTFGQNTHSKFMQNYIRSNFPMYDFKSDSTSALITIDGIKTEFNDLYIVGRKNFNKITLLDKNLASNKNKYGVDANNGVFVIETKSYSAKQWISSIVKLDTTGKLNQMIENPKFDSTRLMIIVNDRELNTDFYNGEKINPNSITKIEFQTFGKKVNGGILTIETHKK